MYTYIYVYIKREREKKSAMQLQKYMELRCSCNIFVDVHRQYRRVRNDEKRKTVNKIETRDVIQRKEKNKQNQVNPITRQHIYDILYRCVVKNNGSVDTNREIRIETRETDE
mgnify:CR=1 FL=1